MVTSSRRCLSALPFEAPRFPPMAARENGAVKNEACASRVGVLLHIDRKVRLNQKGVLYFSPTLKSVRWDRPQHFALRHEAAFIPLPLASRPPEKRHVCYKRYYR